MRFNLYSSTAGACVPIALIYELEGELVLKTAGLLWQYAHNITAKEIDRRIILWRIQS